MRQWTDTGDLGVKSTFGWDETTQSTFLQRTKEEAHDYRYFPDPDLPLVEVSDAWLSEIKSDIGELPATRRKRYVEALGLSPADAAALASDRQTGELYEQAISAGGEGKRVASLILSHGRRIANQRNVALAEVGIKPRHLAELANLIVAGKLAAAEPAGLVLEKLLETDSTAEQTAASLGLIQVSDTAAIDAAIDAVVAANPKPLQDYKAGKQTAMGALVGMVMKNGRGLNAKMVQERLKQKLGG
jgi:aspartyl-tRNA(Asn)/glutamyl-tRNA(Gln) amidotransferase subunit B